MTVVDFHLYFYANDDVAMLAYLGLSALTADEIASKLSHYRRFTPTWRSSRFLVAPLPRSLAEP